MIIKKVIYLHSRKENMYDIGVSLGLEGEALHKFLYCCYEIGVEVAVDSETGNVDVLGLVE
jgi:hypothetical protein